MKIDADGCKKWRFGCNNFTKRRHSRIPSIQRCYNQSQQRNDFASKELLRWESRSRLYYQSDTECPHTIVDQFNFIYSKALTVDHPNSSFRCWWKNLVRRLAIYFWIITTYQHYHRYPFSITWESFRRIRKCTEHRSSELFQSQSRVRPEKKTKIPFLPSDRTFLNVNNTALSNLSTVLQRFHIWQSVLKLPKELDEPVSSLAQDERQLLCIAKFWLMLKPVNCYSTHRPVNTKS